MQTAVDPLVGRTLEGRYRILDRIARGGMSTVYAAVDERLDRLVAVKVMSSALSADPAFTDRFAREARAAARLTHLNVVSVYDQGHDFSPDGHHVFLVMELVDGRTLRDLLQERGRLSVPQAVSIMEPVLSALASAHRAGLVHRDVKPENILLSDQGVVKVADFGLARAIETDPTSTRTGLMMGTIAYCPPEQLSRGVCDPRSDVYSAGVVFFELLTGEPPYRGESAMTIAYQHVHSRVPAPSSRVSGIPEPVDELIVAATDSDPTGRPSDAGTFLAELADVRADLGLPVTPVPPRPRAPGRPGSAPGRDSGRSPGHDSGGTDARTTRAFGRRGGRATPATGAAGDTATDSATQQLRTRAVRHDTIVERPDPGSGPAPDAHRPARGTPPPPVVFPPPRASAVAPRRRRRRRALIGLIVVILLGLAAFFGAQALIKWRFAHVPSVAGLSRQRAVTSLRDAGYRVRVLPGAAFNGTVPAGEVVRTQPSGGVRLATGKTVVITLSAGPHYYQIPSVRNLSYDRARAVLHGIGPVRVADPPQQATSKDVKEGYVIRTVPPAGRQVRRGDTITIWVSKGPPTVAIPDVHDLTLLRARHQLLKAGFSTTKIREYSNTVPPGDVLGTEPTGSALYGSPVTIRVSRGPQMTTVPDISIGTPLDQAEQQLRDQGLVPAVQSVGAPGAQTYALYTRPRAGDQVLVGSTVTIYAYSM